MLSSKTRLDLVALYKGYLFRLFFEYLGCFKTPLMRRLDIAKAISCFS